MAGRRIRWLIPASLAILAGRSLSAQTTDWDSIDVTDAAAVRRYIRLQPQGPNIADARLALQLHTILQQIRAGTRKPELAIAVSEMAGRFTESDDVTAPYLLGIAAQRRNVAGSSELISFGGHKLSVETATELGIVKDGWLETIGVMDVLGQPTTTLYIQGISGGTISSQNSPKGLRYPNVPGSIIAINAINWNGGEFPLADRVTLTPADSVLYFAYLPRLGLVHVYGKGSAKLSDGTVVQLGR